MTVLTFMTPLALSFSLNAEAVSPATSATTCSGATLPGLSTGANLKSGGGTAVNCASTGVSQNTLASKAGVVVNFFSVIVGAISVIMIIYGGFRYITSGGDSGRVGNAKNTLIYAVIGLFIVALAQLIVHFVLSQSSSVLNGG
ncbi:MAG: pilin [Candidatus Saccharimonadales bacterium]